MKLVYQKKLQPSLMLLREDFETEKKKKTQKSEFGGTDQWLKAGVAFTKEPSQFPAYT